MIELIHYSYFRFARAEKLAWWGSGVTSHVVLQPTEVMGDETKIGAFQHCVSTKQKACLARPIHIRAECLYVCRIKTSYSLSFKVSHFLELTEGMALLYFANLKYSW